MNLNPSHIKLSRLLMGLTEAPVVNDHEITGISMDSRNVASGDLFIALPGTLVHGNDYISAAIEQGAAAVVYGADENVPEAVSISTKKDIALIQVNNITQQAGIIASRFYGDPSVGIAVTGITGTNGKTSCSILLAQSFEALGTKAGVIGTLGNGIWGHLQTSTHTTPDAVTLQKQIFDIQEAGAEQLLMEVSSHGLQQARVSGTKFNAAVFTNLSQDHLDYHGSMQQYATAKAKLFYQNDLNLAVINADDEFGRELLEGPIQAEKIISYGVERGDVRASQISMHASGIRFDVQSPWGELQIECKLIGRFNVYNLLASAAVLLANGYRSNDVAKALSATVTATGRMESFVAEGVTVIVDFAHSPDALQQALIALREHINGAQLICVFGCGGDRDQAKRPIMGKIAEQFADTVIITDDNPRHEDSAAIRADILAGMAGSVQQIADRKQAINTAWQLANPGDIILIAGKGHETTQQVGDLKIPYDDRAVVSDLLNSASDSAEGQI